MEVLDQDGDGFVTNAKNAVAFLRFQPASFGGGTQGPTRGWLP